MCYIPKIGQGSTDKGHRRRHRNTGDQTSDEKSLDVLGHGLGDKENDGYTKGTGINGPTTDNLGKWGENHGTNTETHDEKSNGEKGDLTVAAKLLLPLLDTGGDNGRTKGDDQARQGDRDSADPLTPFGPVLRVLGVVDGEGNELVISLLTGFGDSTLRDNSRGRLGHVLGDVGIVGEGTIRKVGIGVFRGASYRGEQGLRVRSDLLLDNIHTPNLSIHLPVVFMGRFRAPTRSVGRHFAEDS